MSTPAGKTVGKGVNLYTPSTNKASNILNFNWSENTQI